MAPPRLTEAEKAARAAARAAAKAAATNSPEAKQAAAAGLVGVAPLDPENTGRIGRFVSVACKIPHGLIIQAYEKRVEYEDVMGGGKRAVDRYRAVGQQYKIHGTIAPRGERAPHIRDNSGGYAVTEGIPYDVWENWMRANEQSAYVQNDLVFGSESLDRVLGWARDHAAVRTNFEALNVSLVPDASGNRRIADLRARRVAPAVTDGAIEVGAG